MQFWNTLFISSQTDRLRSRNRVLRLCSVLVLVAGLLSQPVSAQESGPDPVLLVGTYTNILRFNSTSGTLIDKLVDYAPGFRTPAKLVIGPDGYLYVLINHPGESGGQILRYNATTGALIDTFIDLTAHGWIFPTAMMFGPDGNLYIGGQYRYDSWPGSGVWRFNTQTGALIDIIIPQIADNLSVFDIAFGLDGNLYIAATGGLVINNIQQYNGTTGVFIKNFISNVLGWKLLFLPDGRLYIADSEHVLLYDGLTGRFISNFADARGSIDLAFGPDNNLYVLLQQGRVVNRYNGSTGELLDVFIPGAPGETATAMLFYPDGTPPPPPPSAETGHAADVTLSHRSSPNLQVAPNDIVVDTIKVVNHGLGDASEVIVSMPFDPTQVEIIDASFSRPTAWVSQLLTDSLEIRTGPLHNDGDTVTATVRLRIRPEVTPGTALSLQLGYRWLNAEVHGGGDANSNRLPLTAGQATIDAPWYPLAITPGTAPAGTQLRLSSASFAPGEPVALWYNGPHGATEVGRHSADAGGALEVVFDSAGLSAGGYSMVAYGLWSEITAVGAFQIE